MHPLSRGHACTIVPPVLTTLITEGGLCTTSVPLVTILYHVLLYGRGKMTVTAKLCASKLVLHIVVDLAGPSSNDVIVQILYASS